MDGRIFVLRPEPGLSATIARGQERGLEIVAMPLSHAEPLAWQVPADDFDGILLGSANGLRHAGDSLSMLAGLPVYAVGEATARAARKRGFAVAQTGAGGLQALVDRLPEDRSLRLLRMAGAERLPLAPPAHIAITTVETYRIVHRALTAEDTAALAGGGVVLLHSGAAAQHFVSECDRAGLDRSVIAFAALAPRIVTSVSDGWKSVEIASTPDDAALLSLAADMCH